jgi:iron complex outermembrane recepter protein
MSRKTRRNAAKNAARQTRTAANHPLFTRIEIPGLALGALAFSSSLFAADATPAPATSTGSGDEIQEVVITGIRASLQKSLDIKRESVGVVDAISAEDIGKFPDSNLATAMERIPGVTVSRATTGNTFGGIGGVSSSTGNATQVTVRGFGPTFNETLYDGRQVPTSTGNRGFDFGSVGADFVGQLDVLKTPDSSLSSGAIGATINIKYPKPFDSPGLRLSGSASGTRSDSASTTPNVSVLFSDTFADDRFGILADWAYADNKTRGNHVDVQGWEGGRGDGNSGLAPCQLKGAGPCAVAPNKSDANGVNLNPSTIKDWFIQDYGVYQEHNDDKRIGGRLVLQARPTDSLEITVDDNYTKETLTEIQQGFSVWFNNSSLTNVTQAADGTVTSFLQADSPTDFQAAVNGQVVQDNTLGLNVKWNATDHTSYLFDAYTARSRLNPDGQLSTIDADVGYGNNAANNSTFGVVVNGSKDLPYPIGYGPGSDAARFLDPTIIGSHVLVEESFQNTDTINQFKLQGSWFDDQTKISYGVQFTHDEWQRRHFTDLPFTWQMYAGYGPTGTGGVAPIPANLISGSFATGSNFISGWGNGGKLPPAILAANGYAILNYLQGLNGAGMNGATDTNTCSTPSGGVLCTGRYIMYEISGDHQDVIEKTTAPYLSLTEKAAIVEMPLTISLGVRLEDTHVDSTGLQQLPVGQLTIVPTDHTAYNVTPGPLTSTTVKSEYRYLLPNIDLNLAVTDSLKVRVDASRTLTRSPLNYLTPSINIPAGQRVGGLNATAGNPKLLPFLSDNFDLGAEWYYAKNSYVSVDAFVKEVSNFIVGATTTQPINGATLPDGSLAQFAVTSQVNGPSAEVRGVEFGLQHMFGDSGFGFQANATFVGTNKPYDPNDLSSSGFAVTGLANSWNFVPFFEKYGFMARLALNHQAEFLNNFLQHQANSQFGAEPVFVKAATRLDLSTSYDINSHFNVYFEALNLTNDVFATRGRFSEQILDVVDTGRTFTLGVHARF